MSILLKENKFAYINLKIIQNAFTMLYETLQAECNSEASRQL